jgi:hypothetical protein
MITNQLSSSSVRQRVASVVRAALGIALCWSAVACDAPPEDDGTMANTVPGGARARAEAGVAVWKIQHRPPGHLLSARGEDDRGRTVTEIEVQQSAGDAVTVTVDAEVLMVVGDGQLHHVRSPRGRALLEAMSDDLRATDDRRTCALAASSVLAASAECTTDGGWSCLALPPSLRNLSSRCGTP